MLQELILVTALLGQFCPFPVPACHPTRFDLNCDGLDPLHCRLYDLDGLAYGDCQPDGFSDDFWTLFDGNFDGPADPCDPADTVLMSPDGIPDGRSSHPLCDLFALDDRQEEGLAFLDADRIAVANFAPYDMVRGQVAGLGFGGGGIDLGPVDCLADGGTVSVHVDTTVPPPGTVLFYVLRWEPPFPGVAPPIPYGYGQCLERAVAAGNGDCVP